MIHGLIFRPGTVPLRTRVASGRRAFTAGDASPCAANAGSSRMRPRSPIATLLSLSKGDAPATASLQAARPVRPPGHRRRSPANPRGRPRGAGAPPSLASRRAPRSRRAARGSSGRHRHPAVSARARARADSRTRIAISAGRRSRPRQDDSGGAMLAELQHRGWCERAIIVTPAGLRQQWADELRRRFDIRAAVIDAASLVARADSLPFDVNPWTVEPVAITSIDFIKQPKSSRALAALVGYPHRRRSPSGCRGSQRYEAVKTLARARAPCRALTATPHAGDERAYRALCESGTAESRRSDRSVPPNTRAGRLSANTTRASAARAASRDAIEMHRLLDDYVARLWRFARFGQARRRSSSRWCSPSARCRVPHRWRYRSSGG